MTAAEFFVLYGVVRGQYYDALDRLSDVRTAATKVTSSMDGVVVSGTRNPHKDDVLIRYAEASGDYERVAERFSRLTDAAAQLIRSVDDPIYRDLLYYRVLRGMTWSRITPLLSDSVSERTVYRRYKTALDEVQKKWKELGYDYIDW